MKKVLIGFALMLVLAIGVSAQDDMGNETMVGKGFKAGGGVFKLSGDDVDVSDSKFGFSGGGFVNYAFSPQISGQLEILYVMKGDKFDEFDETIKDKLDYLSVPVLVVFNIPTEGNFKPNLFAGPEISFLMSAKMSNSEEVDIKDIMKSTDFGIVFGGGFIYQMESFGVVFDIRYNLGMTKIVDYEEWNKFWELTATDEDYLTEDPSVKNGGFSGHIGVSF